MPTCTRNSSPGGAADGQRRCAEWQDYSPAVLLNLRGLQQYDLELGIDAEYEDLLEHKEELLDMSHALEGWNRQRRG